MALVAFELAGNPDVQEKLWQEISQFFQGRSEQKITYEDLNKLRYLDMVLRETLRLHPPATATDRHCVKNFELPPAREGGRGYTVEPGITVTASIIGLHRDSKYFPEPEKFDPERFGEEKKHLINPYAYLPFGLGPRRCIGDRFALMETKILFVHLIRNFVIRLAEEIKYPMVYDKKKLTITPEGGFKIGLEIRKKYD